MANRLLEVSLHGRALAGHSKREGPTGESRFAVTPAIRHPTSMQGSIVTRRPLPGPHRAPRAPTKPTAKKTRGCANLLVTLVVAFLTTVPAACKQTGDDDVPVCFINHIAKAEANYNRA